MTIGKRLREERLRLGYNQKDFGGIYGVSKATQIEYEKDASFPNAKQIENLSQLGADVLYIITGRKDNFSSDELELLTLFRTSPFERKVKAFQALKGEDCQSSTQTITGGLGHNITNTGDINNGNK